MNTHWSAEVVLMPADPHRRLEKYYLRVDAPGADHAAAAAELAKQHPEVLGLHFVRHDAHDAALGPIHLSFYVTDRPDPNWYFLQGREVSLEEMATLPLLAGGANPPKVEELRRRGFRRVLLYRNLVAERAARQRSEAPRPIVDFIGLDDRAVVLPNRNLEQNVEAPIAVDQHRTLDRHGKDHR